MIAKVIVQEFSENTKEGSLRGACQYLYVNQKHNLCSGLLFTMREKPEYLGKMPRSTEDNLGESVIVLGPGQIVVTLTTYNAKFITATDYYKLFCSHNSIIP